MTAPAPEAAATLLVIAKQPVPGNVPLVIGRQSAKVTHICRSVEFDPSHRTILPGRDQPRPVGTGVVRWGPRLRGPAG